MRSHEDNGFLVLRHFMPDILLRVADNNTFQGAQHCANILIGGDEFFLLGALHIANLQNKVKTAVRG